MMLIIMSFGFRLVQRQTAKYNEFVFVSFHLHTKNLSSFPLLSPPPIETSSITYQLNLFLQVQAE